MDLLIEYAQPFGLVFFFTIFVGIFVWVLLPSKKLKLEMLKNIPLAEDENGR